MSFLTISTNHCAIKYFTSYLLHHDSYSCSPTEVSQVRRASCMAGPHWGYTVRWPLFIYREPFVESDYISEKQKLLKPSAAVHSQVSTKMK